MANENGPLGIPDGSVRAILALIVIIGSGVLFGFDKLNYGELMGLVGVPLGLYFGQYVQPPGSGGDDTVGKSRVRKAS